MLKTSAVPARGVAQFVCKIFPQIALLWLKHVSTFQNPADGEAAGEEVGGEWERLGPHPR